ncbi:hypothetical protein Cs7R123_48290 [Catellatospora sp. TT07R-123]|uniref:baseplate J/gp47 family protein n=1 Tax=Catellatospora sp. TT07R-123 TaxID=2733863 RepID=UPI001B13F3A2|nr:baseplate J/gp47 family protein [Catellatospora sp. TT07R-123]GHJ47487.1 hypothetical protein Cs7R123_48290 [Catellatospora sp. TT07R-123]
MSETDCGCGCPDAGGVCRCDGTGRCPWRIWNLPGQASIAYRSGDFAAFRRRMLHRLPGETELDGWRPTASADLALQVVDWWAYVADVLTFYTERIANESFLRTAVLADSVNRLVSVLGYRPRPGIAASATLGVLATGPGPIVIPAGFAVASKATPGVASQTFETGVATAFTSPTSVATPAAGDEAAVVGGPPAGSRPGTADVPARKALVLRGGVLVKGKPTGVAVGDRLLLVPRAWTSADLEAAVVRVTGLVPETDAHRRVNTRVLLEGTGGLSPDAHAADYRLCRPHASNHLITVPSGATVVSFGQLVLDSTARALKAGDPLLVEVPGAGTGLRSGTGFDLVRLTGYAEVLWYANAAPSTPTTSPGANGIPLLVGKLAVAAAAGVDLGTRYGSRVAEVVVRSQWTDVGTLLDTPVTRHVGALTAVRLARPPAAPAGTRTPALVEDARGGGASVGATPGSGGDVALDGADGDFVSPLRMLWDLITLTRGTTVAGESLGTGDASLPGQDFTLSRAPVTYLADTAAGAAPPGTGGIAGTGSRSGPGYSSTVELLVDGLRWREVPMLYGRGPAEQVFVTREDEQGRTHVRTGDGVNGARLPTGAHVVASYRVGSGALAPPAGALTQALRPAANLAALRNPVGAGGGADPDPPERVRDLAPASVLTFGRAVSSDDYLVVAAQAPGVARAGAAWAWDATQQRAMATVYVGDDAAAVASARAALRAAADPNRPVTVLPAVAQQAYLQLVLRTDPLYLAADLADAVRADLLALFAPGGLEVGETLYRSRIEAVCDRPGVLAVHRLWMNWTGHDDDEGPRFSPGAGGYFAVTADRLHLVTEVAPVE